MAKVVIALDKPIDTMKCLMSGVDVVKLHATALLNGELNAIANMVRAYLKEPPEIFLDLKVADISFGKNEGSNYKIIKAVADNYGDVVTYVNLHGFMGELAVREAVAAGGDKVKILVLAGMTDKAYQEKFSPFETQTMCEISDREGAYGVILPGNDMTHAMQLRKIEKGMEGRRVLPIWSPGFGRQNTYGDIYDQLKFWKEIAGDSPDNAAIIGTHLLDHPDLEAEVAKIKEIIR